MEARVAATKPSEVVIYIKVKKKKNPKRDGNQHPHWNKGSKFGYVVSDDGKTWIAGRHITIHWKSKCTIDLTDKSVRNHPFFISRVYKTRKDHFGGLHTGKEVSVLRCDGENCMPTDKGKVTFVPMEDFDFTKEEKEALSTGKAIYRLFYACDNHKYMGGNLFVIGDSVVCVESKKERLDSMFPTGVLFGVEQVSNSVHVLALWRQMTGFTGEIAFVTQSEERYLYVGETDTGIVWEVDMFTTIRGEPILSPDDEEDPLNHAGMWAEKRLFLDAKKWMSPRPSENDKLIEMRWLPQSEKDAKRGVWNFEIYIQKKKYTEIVSMRAVKGEEGEMTVAMDDDTHTARRTTVFKPPRMMFDFTHPLSPNNFVYTGNRSPELKGLTIKPFGTEAVQGVRAIDTETNRTVAFGILPRDHVINGAFKVRENTDEFGGEVFVYSYDRSVGESTIWQVQWE